jgi:hypothetical protein
MQSSAFSTVGRLVRASRSRARTAEAASAVGGGPPRASTSGGRATRPTYSAREALRSFGHHSIACRAARLGLLAAALTRRRC